MSNRCRDVVLSDLFRHVPLAPSVLRDVQRRMCGPRRQYHTLDHLAVMWHRHRRMARGPLQYSTWKTPCRQRDSLSRRGVQSASV